MNKNKTLLILLFLVVSMPLYRLIKEITTTLPPKWIVIVVIVVVAAIIRYARLNEALGTVSPFFLPGRNPNNKKPGSFEDRFLEAYKARGNTCFGLLFDGDKPKKLYLAFSNTKHDDLGSEFNRLGKPELPYVYCQYDEKTLYKTLPIKTWGPDLQLIELSVPFDDLTNDQKTAQTCTERKIIAKVLEESLQTFTAPCLVLISKYAPCKYCLSLIQEQKQRPDSRLEIQVICNDFLEWLQQNKKVLSGEDIYLSALKHAQTIASAAKSKNQNTCVEETEKNTSNTPKKAMKQLRLYAERQYKGLVEKNVELDTIKIALSCLTTTDGKCLPDDQITKIMSSGTKGGKQS